MTGLPLYAERAHRLALGLEPRDAARGGRVPFSLLALRELALPGERLERLAREDRWLTEALPALRRLESCRHVLLHAEIRRDPLDPTVTVRLLEGAGRYPPRRYVPRRIRVPIGDPDDHDTEPTAWRVRRPALHPGSDYPIHESATAIRGRVARGGEPLRWARIQAFPPDEGACPPVGDAEPIALAHGDDRGEFLLVLPHTAAAPGGGLEASVCIRAWGPPPLPEPEPPLGRIDPHWDLPVEELALGDTAAERGAALPADYTLSGGRVVTVPLGRVTSGLAVFSIA